MAICLFSLLIILLLRCPDIGCSLVSNYACDSQVLFPFGLSNGPPSICVISDIIWLNDLHTRTLKFLFFLTGGGEYSWRWPFIFGSRHGAKTKNPGIISLKKKIKRKRYWILLLKGSYCVKPVKVLMSDRATLVKLSSGQLSRKFEEQRKTKNTTPNLVTGRWPKQMWNCKGFNFS